MSDIAVDNLRAAIAERDHANRQWQQYARLEHRWRDTLLRAQAAVDAAIEVVVDEEAVA